MNEQSNDKSGEDPIESSAEELEVASTDQETEGSTEGSTEESVAESTEDSTEDSTEESSAASTEELTEEPVDDSTEATAEDTDEQASDGAAAEADASVVNGTVKWFNAEKGFGFIVADDGSGDVFLHLSALRQAGLETVEGGATIVCAVSRGPKGFQVDRVIEVDESTASPSVQHRPRSPLGFDRPRHAPLTDVGEFVMATVKWFNPNKGFGFITVDETSPDVFVHMQTLRRCGVATLDTGQEVRVRIGQGAKGPQVSDIEVG